jgi:hypothetical protein
MRDMKFMQTCQICNASYQMGIHRYDGKHIAKYNLDVCRTCYEANVDGWCPSVEGIILAHLKKLKMAVPERQADGYLPRN